MGSGRSLCSIMRVALILPPNLLLLPLSLLPLNLLQLAAAGKSGLLVAGGEDVMNSVEVWTPEASCTLPDLSREVVGATLGLVNNDTIALCQGDRCDHLTWKWQKWANTTWYRNFATSATTPAGLLLVGGFSAPWTSEVISSQGESREAFVPNPGRTYHCSIQVSESVIVLTGGYENSTSKLASEYSGIDTDKVSVRELARLVHGRHAHACGAYNVAEAQMLIVAGGTHLGNKLKSTEVLAYSEKGNASWRSVGQLPVKKCCFNGATVDGVFHVAGGEEGVAGTDQVLSWDAVSETWIEVGQLRHHRKYHAVMAVPLHLVEDHCSVFWL